MVSFGDSVGDAYIEVGAEDDTDADLIEIEKKLIAAMKKAAKKAGREIIDGFDHAGDEAGDAMLHQLEKDFKLIEHQLNELTKPREIDIGANAFLADAAARIAYVARDRIVNLWLRIRGNAAAQIETIVKGLSGVTLLRSWTDGLVNLAGALPAVILRFGFMAMAVTSVIAPLMNMLTAIAPISADLGAMVPILLAAPAAFAAMAAGIGVLVMAFTDLENASTQSGQRAFEQISFLKEAFAGLQDAVQSNFWDGFIDPFERLTNTLLPQLQTGLTGVAAALGSQWGAAADAITNQLGSNGLQAIFDNMSAGITAASPGFAAIAAALTRITEQGSTLFPMFGEWITRIGTAFNDWAQKADIAGLIENAATQMGHLWDVAKELWGVISGIFTAMDTGQSTGLESLAATLGKISDVVNGPVFQLALGQIFAGASAGASALADALTPIGDSLAALAPTIAYFLSAFGGAAASVFTDIAAALAAPVAQGGLQLAIAAITDMMMGIDWSQFSTIIGTLGQIIAAVAPSVMGLVNAFLPLVNAVLPVLLSLVQAIAPLLPILVAAFQPLVDLLAAYLVPVIELLAPLFTHIVEAIAPLVAIIAAELVPVFDAIMEILIALMPSFMAIVDILGAILPPIIGAVAQILEALIGALAKTGNKATDMSVLFEVMGAIVKGIFETLGNVISAVIIAVIGVIDIFLALMGGNFQGVIDKSVQLVKDIFASFGIDIDQIVNNIIGFITTLISDWQGLFRSLVDTVRNKGLEIISWFVNLPNEIRNAFIGAGTWLVSVGRDILNGLWNGLKSIWTNVSNWFKNTIGGIVNTAKSLLGINSPSKVFMGIGESITEGFVDGLAGLEAAASKSLSISMKGLTMDVGANLPKVTSTGNAASVVNNSSSSQTTFEKGAFEVEGADPYDVSLQLFNRIGEKVGLAA